MKESPPQRVQLLPAQMYAAGSPSCGSTLGERRCREYHNQLIRQMTRKLLQNDNPSIPELILKKA